MKTRLIITVLLIAAPALWLKKFYGTATSESLDWILTPTATLVNIVPGMHFIREPGLGWFDSAQSAAIVPSCAGVNFLIVAFAVLSLCGVWNLRSPFAQLVWTAVTALAALAATVVVNALRIWLSMELYHIDIYTAQLTPALIHRVCGVTIYYTSLLCLFCLASAILHRVDRISKTTGNCLSVDWGWWLAPLIGYLLVTLGAPLVTGNYRDNVTAFTEHAVTIMVISVLLSLPVVAVRVIKSKPATTYETTYPHRRR
jgi:exosortase K